VTKEKFTISFLTAKTAFLNKTMSPLLVAHMNIELIGGQGDQIGRIFAYWVTVYFG
jgi:hypothetical protein